MIQPKEGVYMSRHGKFKIFYTGTNEYGNAAWFVDEDKIHPAPLLKALRVKAVHNMSVGFPVFDSFGCLYKCEYLGEL
jgi:hypothetical protein